MSQWHTFEFCDNSRFLSHDTYLFLVFSAKPKMWHETYKSHKCHKPKGSTGLFSDVPHISRFRSYVSLGQKPLKTQKSWYWPRLRFRFWISLGTTFVRNCTKASWNKAAVEPVHYYRPQLTQNWFSGTDSKGPVLFGLIVQFKQKRGTGVENPSSRSF
jgi:hypothetical protein